MKQITGTTIDDLGLPQAIWMEKLVLGAILRGFIDFELVRGSIEIADFALDSHRLIWSRMLQMFEDNVRIDLGTLGQKLLDARELEAVGGIPYLLGLDNDMPGNVNTDEYIKTIRDKSILRKVVYLGEKLKSEAILATGNPAELLLKAEGVLSSLGMQATSDDTFHTPLQIIQKAGSLQKYLERRSGLGITTGFDRLNAMTSGFRRKQLVVLASGPGAGKSSLMRLMALNAAGAGHPVGVISLEMSEEEVLDGMICAHGDIDTQVIRRGIDQDRAKVRLSASEVVDMPIYIRDKSGVTIDQVHGEARKLKSEHDIRVLYVDYLQLMSSGRRNENRVNEVGAISRGLKLLAMDLDIPVVALSQLKRLGPGNPRPELHDLRESGSIEQDCDIAMFLWSEFAGSDLEVYPTELILRKQRNGPIGTILLNFHKRTVKFVQSASQTGRVEA